jgi:hypothetical protein
MEEATDSGSEDDDDDDFDRESRAEIDLSESVIERDSNIE